ncbi:MAG TPA: response regulator transcription factor [Actinomycetota bacterium]|nr:response regulator transcription factor [Actinomycetota bacterium]
MADTITVVIGDDHPLVRFAVRQTLEADEAIEVLGEGRTGREVVDLARDLRPDAVVLDYRMPVMDGMAAARIISEELPRTRILMLTGEEDPVVVEEAVDAGVHGFVQKTDPSDALPRWIRESVQTRPELKVVADPDGLDGDESSG